MMSEVRALADAVVVGGKTFRNWPLPMIEKPEHLEQPRRRAEPLWNVVLTGRGVSGASAARWPDPRVRLMICGPSDLDAEAHRRAFGAEVVTSPQPSIEWVLTELESRGCETVLIEGGGEMIFACLRAGRLHEMYVTVCPMVIGGRNAPSPADGEGFLLSEIRKLRLRSAQQRDQEIFLHYDVRQ